MNQASVPNQVLGMWRMHVQVLTSLIADQTSEYEG